MNTKSMMRCAACGRALMRAAALRAGQPIVRTCALKAGLIKRTVTERTVTERQAALNFNPPTPGQEARQVDTATIPLFDHG